MNFDEASFRLVPKLTRVWAPRGTRPKGVFWWSNKKANIFGALIDGNELYYEWYEHLNATTFIEFITRFVTTLDPTKTYVFVFDNAPAHKAKKTQTFLATLAPNILIERLPTYSPQLNAIETCWKIVRHDVTNSNLYQNIEHLKSGIESFLEGHFFMLNPTNYLIR